MVTSITVGIVPSVSKPALLKKGLLRAEPSGHPEGARAPEGSPTIRWDAVLNEVRDASLTLGRTDGVGRDCCGGESLSGHPEGAKALEESPTISG